MKTALPDPARRLEPLRAHRDEKMAASAHAYVRGSTRRFYQWLERSGAAMPAGPAIWICGDCHVGNLGPVASADGTLAIQIRDLDQTVIGDPAHDMIRLGLSLAMAARGSDLPGVTTAHMIERTVRGYEDAFGAADREDASGAAGCGDASGAAGRGDASGAAGRGDASHDDAPAMPRTVRRVMRAAARRSWKHLADERIEGTEPVIPLGKRFWPLSDAERDGVHALVGREEIRRLATSLRSRDDDAAVRVLDAAYWRKGCSSLGRLRLAVLVAIGSGRRERHCLLDIKEAIAAAAPAADGAAMPSDHAERVIAGARGLSPHLGERMVAGRLMDRPVFVRELLPQDLKIEIEALSREEATSTAEFLAHVVGRSHARQMDPAARAAWLAELRRGRDRTIDAPSWLWRCVVELVSVHEAAYLDFCREWSFATAA